jgi:sortase A
MRKAGIIFFALFLMHVSAFTTFAGTINPEEARVIDAASGYFDYFGEKYVATEGSLAEMTAYLNQDSVDLTETQANRAIQLMQYYKNIKTAIDGGYLVPVEADPGNGGGDGGGDGNGGDGTGGGDGITDPDGQPGEDTVKPGFVKIMFREGIVQGFDNQDNLVFSGGLPVKNTGYDISILLIPILILVALATGLLVFVKKEIRFIVVPLVFVLLLAGVLGTVGASAKNLLLTNVESAMILGAPEIDYLPDGMQSATTEIPQTGILNAKEAKLPAVGAQYGQINCEEVNLAAPLYFGDDDAIFEKGAGQYVMSGIPGEGRPILIGGHDVTYFAPLEQIKVGDEVTVTTAYGMFVYRVIETKIESVEKWKNETLNGNQETLILYTCYPFGNVFGAREDRFYVICDKQSGPVIPDSSLNR